MSSFPMFFRVSAGTGAHLNFSIIKACQVRSLMFLQLRGKDPRLWMLRESLISVGEIEEHMTLGVAYL